MTYDQCTLTMPDDTDFGLPTRLLDLVFGDSSVGDNLHAGLASGALVRLPEGRFTLPAEALDRSENWLHFKPVRSERASCHYLFNVLFDVIYARAAIPLACQDCYKVKACPASVKGLLALRNLSRSIACNSKFGAEVNYLYSQDLYGGYYYCHGLEHARAVYRQVREAVDASDALGPAVAMRIKRGCTPYEIHCGPSNQWQFDARQAELEAHLLGRFVLPVQERPAQEFAILMQWVQTAHTIGDDSYLEFTKGRRLFPATVSYDP